MPVVNNGESDSPKGKKYKGKLLKINGLSKNEVAYNPFPVGEDSVGRNIIVCRVESRDSDWKYRIHDIPGTYDPHCEFFYEKDGELFPLEDAPVFEGYEDPSCNWINIDGDRLLMFSAVTVDFSKKGFPRIMTKVFIAPSIYSLSPKKAIAELPEKDNRFCQTTDGDLVMLNRPVDGAAFPGGITFSRLTFEELKDPKKLEEKVKEAKLLKFDITGRRMGGSSIYSKKEATNLSDFNEKFLLICHAAQSESFSTFDQKSVLTTGPGLPIHYKGYQAIIDPDKLDDVIQLTELVTAQDFPLDDKKIKAPRYEDVVFPGGLLNDNLYLGVGDGSVGKIPIKTLI